jgi:hypothetical protein
LSFDSQWGQCLFSGCARAFAVFINGGDYSRALMKNRYFKFVCWLWTYGKKNEKKGFSQKKFYKYCACETNSLKLIARERVGSKL